jgi:lipoprotein-anchoring transpeptidase ErfK/SrfK
MLSRQIKLSIIVFLLMLPGVVPVQAQGKYDPSVCAKDNTGKPLSQACQDMIKAFPRPKLDEIPKDNQTIEAYSFWRVGPEPINLYDSPNGNVVGQIAKGFNFVRAINLDVEGWIQIQGGRWINRNEAKEYKASYFSGVALPDGLEHEFAWVLDKSSIYTSEYPGGPTSAKTKRALIRYERVNIFATAKDDKGVEWYMIGPNQWVKHTFVAKVKQIEPPKDVSGHWIAVDLYEQTLVAYEDEKPVFATLISSGLPKHDTNEGTFKVWARLTQDSMSGATGAPSAYALQFVPWVMYFDESISLHGTYWHDLFGYRQSHGCVNLSISDARWLFNWMKEGPADEKGEPVNYVYVYASGKYGSDVLRQ